MNRLDVKATENLVFFDMDNTLYPASTGIGARMGERITAFFRTRLGLPEAEAYELGERFYNDYGLAIKGALEHFSYDKSIIDPKDYDAFVDGGLPLEALVEYVKGSDAYKTDINAIKSMQARRWILTNAGPVHAKRVIDILNVDNLFEGVIYCDYSEPDFCAKPQRRAYERAEEIVRSCGGSTVDHENIYFIDDSLRNIQQAHMEMGWRSAWLCEDPSSALDACHYKSSIVRIQKLSDLPSVFPELYHKHDILKR